MQLDYTHVCVVLDASGSMESIKTEVQRSLVNFCAEQRKKAAQGEKIAVDLYQFENEVSHLAHNSTLEELERFVDRYECGACTALYDAVCQGIDELGAFFAALPEDKRPEDVLFVIVTDGYENASKRFKASDVKTRIEHQRDKYSWNFVFLASGIDVERAAAEIGILADEAVAFDREEAEEDICNRMNLNMLNVREARNSRRKN